MTGEQYPASQGNAGPNLSLGYDTMGRPYSATDLTVNQSVVGSASYGAASQLLTLSGGFGTETRTYNAMLQLTGISSPGVNLQYSYSGTQNNGKIVSQTNLVSGEQVSYTYDMLNRLASAASNQGWSQSFGYDGFGNLSNVNAVNAPGLGVVYDPATNHGPCSDANGNDQSCAYIYDIENRTTSTRLFQVGTRYSYAPGNKRVWHGTWSGDYTVGFTRGVDEVTYWSPAGQKLATYQLSVSGSQLVATQTGAEYYFSSRLIKNAKDESPQRAALGSNEGGVSGSWSNSIGAPVVAAG